ncbi:MAG: hypothetical protein V4586_09950 [Pseudomonadota bacterium]
MRQLLSVTPQLRRTYINCFPGLDLQQAKIDDIFYARLTELLNGDLGPIMRFDRILMRDKKSDKAISVRARKALFQHIGAPEDIDAETDALTSLVENNALPIEARQLAWLLLRLGSGGQTAAKVNKSEACADDAAPLEPKRRSDTDRAEDGFAQDETQDWAKACSKLTQLLQRSTQPDCDLAQAMRTEVETLMVAAERHRAKSQERNRAFEHFAKLRARLDDCLTQDDWVNVAWPLSLPSQFDLTAVDHLIAQTEQATRTQVEAERAAIDIKEAVARANDLDDDNAEFERLAPLRKTVIAAHQAAKTARTVALADLTQWLAGQAEPQPTAQTILETLDEPQPENTGAQYLSEADPIPLAVVEPVETSDVTAMPDTPDAEPEQNLPMPDDTQSGLPPEATDASVVEDDTAALLESTAQIEAQFDLQPSGEKADTPGILIEATTKETTLASDGWSGGPDMATLVADYLKRGETAFASELVNLADARGIEVPIAGVILRALHESRIALRPHDSVSGRLTGALDQAVAVVASPGVGQDEEQVALGNRLAAAALLRPALFGSYDFARRLLRQLRLTGPERLLAKVIGDLGYDVLLTFDEMCSLKGNVSAQSLPALAARMAEMGEVNRKKKLNYQPASDLLHRLFEPNGDIGQAFAAAIANGPDAIAKVEALLDHLPAEASELTAYIEDRASNLLSRRAPIEGNALRMLCKLTEAAGELLQDWLAAAQAELGQTDDRRRRTLQTSIGQVRKASEALLAELTLQPDESLAGAVELTLYRAVQDLIRLCDGQEPDLPAPRLASGLHADLLRLTGGAQPRHNPGEAYLQETRDQRDALFAALRQPHSHAPDLATAFDTRLADRATLAAHDILTLAKRAPRFTKSLDMPEAEMRLREHIETQRKLQRQEVEALSSRLAMLWHLAGEDRDQISNAMQRLALIEAALQADPFEADDAVTIPALNGLRSAVLPPDFPELGRVLEQFNSLVERRSAQIAADQRRRLEELARQEAHRHSARQLLDRLADFDPVTLDSMIGQIQDGLPFAAIESKAPDGFGHFHPDFVTAMAARSDQPTKLVEATLQGKNPLGLPPMEYGPNQVKRALDLMRFWSSFNMAMRSGNADQLRGPLLTLLGSLGFVRSKLENGAQLIRNRLHRFTLSASLQLGREQFLPPIYGSEARGLYNILIAEEGLRDKELAAHLGTMGRDQPSFLIVLGRLDRRRRESLAHELRLERQAAVLLDESLMVHIALGDGDPLETLFACGLPFGYVQPYTTNPRSIPPEMFFGRKDEIQKIMARQNGGCLVYGGRQLGKSALLNHVKRLIEDQQDGNRRAIYLDIKQIGGRGVPADRIWRALADELAQADILDLKDYTAESFRTEVRRWIMAKPDRQLLVMLDEADNFLAAEARHGSYANLQVLKDLMETLHWNFKVVFAGLHNVRRMSKAVNSPLPHLGQPICVGPLDSNADNLAEARRLVTAPMRAAGYDYADPNLAYAILARVNYYPSLVQVFCQTVVENAGKVRRAVGSGPYWKLGNMELFEGAIGRTINEEIQKRFQVTLELDWRYEAIAKVIALLGIEGPEGNTRILRSGLPAAEIQAMVSEFWPQHIPPLALHDFRVLLEEMMDLGVLSQPSEGLFVLRNAQVAQLLGTREELVEALLIAMEREEQVDYDASTFHSPYGASAPDDCAPLTDGQLDSLLDDRGNRGTVGLIVVHKTLWGSHNLNGLKDLIEARSDPARPLSVALVAAQAKAIRSQIDARLDHPHERRVLLIEGEWDAKAAQFLAEHARVKDGVFRPIWLVPPAWLIEAHRNRDLPTYTQPHCAQPWTSAMLRHWLDTHGLIRFDQPDLREALLMATGGLPARLRALLPVLRDPPTHLPADLSNTIRAWQPAQGRDGLHPDLAAFGFTPGEAARLNDLALELMTSKDGTADATLLSNGKADDLIASACALGLLYQRHDRITLSPLGRLMIR